MARSSKNGGIMKINLIDWMDQLISHHSDGKIGCASYYVNNLKHRLHFPSIIRYSENGSKSSEAFNVNYENGTIWSEKWFLDRCMPGVKME